MLKKMWKCESCKRKFPGKVSSVTGKKLCMRCWHKQLFSSK
jgi:DNA-directed RNA polymerase subunit RPC12/RpoP